MPKTACPACKSAVKYPKDAEPGTVVTCPDCDEEFVPPKLKEKAKKYDLDDEETYTVGRSRSSSDAHETDKTRHAAAAMSGAQRRARELTEASNQRRPWFEGPEIWLLIFGIGAGGGLPFGIWLASNWQKMSDAKVFWLFLVLIAVMMAAIGLGGSAWSWLRRNQ